MRQPRDDVHPADGSSIQKWRRMYFCLRTGPQSAHLWRPIYKISYDYLTIMPKLQSTYDGRLIYKTSYEGRKAFLRYDSLAKL